MTNATDRGANPVPSDPTLPPCPEWCETDGRYSHHYDDDGLDGRPVREHAIEYDDLLASEDRPAPGRQVQPCASVWVTVKETSYYDHLELGVPRVAVAAEQHPQFTPTEARQLAAMLIAAADRADEIAAGR